MILVKLIKKIVIRVVLIAIGLMALVKAVTRAEDKAVSTVSDAIQKITNQNKK